MDKQLQEIFARREKRNIELDQICKLEDIPVTPVAKEKENQDEQVSVLRHAFTPTPKKINNIPTSLFAPASSPSSPKPSSAFKRVPPTPPPKPSTNFAANSTSPITTTPKKLSFQLSATSTAKTATSSTSSTDELLSAAVALHPHFSSSKAASTTAAVPSPKHQSISFATAPDVPTSPKPSLSVASVSSAPAPSPKSSTSSTVFSTRKPDHLNNASSRPAAVSVSSCSSAFNDDHAGGGGDSAAVFRPITPTERIIGSLWDEINAELEKYKQERKDSLAAAAADPNLSPRSRFAGRAAGGEYEFRSSALLSGSSNKRAGDRGETSAAASADEENGSAVSLSSSESALPAEKKQRSENGSESPDPQQLEKHEAVLKRLHEMIIVQQDQICQSSRALAFCRQNDHFRGSREEVDAQRALLISTERRRALMAERDRHLHGALRLNLDEPRGTLSFSSISIKLARDFVNTYAQMAVRYYFIVLIKCGEHVFHTSLAYSDHAVKSGFIEYSHFIPISGLTADFKCELEVYSLKASQQSTLDRRATGRSRKGTWRRMVTGTPLNAYHNTFSSFSTYSTGGMGAHRPVGVMDSGFQRVGKLTVTRQLLGRGSPKFELMDTAYPLEGSVLLTMDCRADPPAEGQSRQQQHRSFLSLYQLVSGYGAWTRFWCALSSGQLRFWRYPEYEESKEPCVTVELAKCVTQVSIVPPSTASFPNSMQMDLLLVDERTNQKEAIRMLLAADSPEERDLWLDRINKAIRSANVWRSMKAK